MPQMRIVCLGHPVRDWNTDTNPYKSFREYPRYEPNIAYAQLFPDEATEERWDRLVTRIYSLLFALGRTRGKAAIRSAYQSILLGDYFPRLIQRFGYSRVPIWIQTKIKALEKHLRLNNDFHFWGHDFAPTLNENRTIADERRGQGNAVSDSDNDDDGN